MPTELNHHALAPFCSVCNDMDQKLVNQVAECKRIGDEFQGKTFGGTGGLIAESVLEVCGLFEKAMTLYNGVRETLAKKTRAILDMHAKEVGAVAAKQQLEQAKAKLLADFRATRT